MPRDGAGDQLAHALRLAYSYLDRRERTVGEARSYLDRKGFDAATTERAVAALTEQGHLDDHRFVRLFIADKRELEQWGAERIKRTLLQREIEPEMAAGALDDDAESNPYEAELDRALELLSLRFPSPPQSRRDRDRALGVLVRKGYEPEIALEALAAYSRGE